MKPQPIQRYFFFGTCLRYLQNIPSGTRVGDDEQGGMYVRSNLRELFGYIKELNLPVTIRHTAYEKLAGILGELDSLPDETLLSKEHAVAIQNGIEQIRETLEAELRGV